MSEPRIKKKKIALVSKFATIIGISVFYTVFFISAYNLYASTPIVKQYRTDKTNEFSSIGKIIYEKFKNYNKEGEPDEYTQILITDLIKNNLVMHVGVVNNETKEYEWSTIQELEGIPTNIKDPLMNNEFKKKFFILKNSNLHIEKYNLGNSHLVISFFLDDSLLNLVEILIRGNLTLAVTFIIFGFLSASILARQVTRPIEKLVIGVWEFSKGNLDYRTSIETDDEIGILAKAFNYMAERLKDLYTSLEKKVKERTLELSKKNDELNQAYRDLTDAQSLLVHNEKMRSLGELVAGVAHELNNPINFIYGNMAHLKEYCDSLVKIITKYENIQKNIESEEFDEIENLKQEVDYEFLKEDIVELIKSCAEGAERSKQIVIDLKNFSRLDQGMIKEVDINESIDSTLNILNNKYKNRINIHKLYNKVPLLKCYAGQLNQVFMNILDNAAQAIQDSGDVYIRTNIEDEKIIIEFEDSGQGIDSETLPKIFDPFFTTKPVGTGSGMGLAITYKIVKSHNGTIEVETEKGKGTKFTIKIPLICLEEDQSLALEEQEKVKEQERV